MTLHEAMIIAIRELGGGKQHITDIANYINEHKLYVRGDGAPVLRNQISARINKYPHLFSRAEGYVWKN